MTVTANAPLIAAIDIGTSKVVALIAQINTDNELEIIGVGNKASRGLKKGDVVDIDQTMTAIRGAVQMAEMAADCVVHSAYIGISGAHIGGKNSQAVVAIPDKEVQKSDIERVIEAAKSGPIPGDQCILHTLQQEFLVDGQADVRSPLGMSGVRLEGHVHLVTCSVNAKQNLEKCVRGCDIEIDEVVLQHLASSHAVLTDDEKEHGVCLVDIGAGTTDIAIFANGAIRHTAVIPAAGNQVTNDIAKAFLTPTEEADSLKVRYACAASYLVDPNQVIQVPGMGDRPERDLQRQVLAAVVEPRYEEIFTMIQQEISKSGYEGRLSAGVVLTGGASRIEGARELAEAIFHLPVRIGMPKSLKMGGLGEVLEKADYSAAVGLLLYGKSKWLENPKAASRESGAGVEEIFQKIRDWFFSIRGFFSRFF